MAGVSPAGSSPSATSLLERLRPDPGTYVLVLRLAETKLLEAGRLPPAPLRPGFHAYVGSALGPGGVRARLGRHVEGSSVRRWHVDYLRALADPVEAWIGYGRERREHAWAQALAKAPGSDEPVPGFGASDCACSSHLFRFRERPSPKVLDEAAGPTARLALA